MAPAVAPHVSPSPAPRRAKAAIACLQCRGRKLKCDGLQPCNRCKSNVCEYDAGPHRTVSIPPAVASDNNVVEDFTLDATLHSSVPTVERQRALMRSHPASASMKHDDNQLHHLHPQMMSAATATIPMVASPPQTMLNASYLHHSYPEHGRLLSGHHPYLPPQTHLSSSNPAPTPMYAQYVNFAASGAPQTSYASPGPPRPSTSQGFYTAPPSHPAYSPSPHYSPGLASPNDESQHLVASQISQFAPASAPSPYFASYPEFAASPVSTTADLLRSRRGRKQDDTLPPSRSREVQRAFRARRAARLTWLESRVSELETENASLRQRLADQPTPSPPLTAGASAESSSEAQTLPDAGTADAAHFAHIDHYAHGSDLALMGASSLTDLKAP